MFSESLLKPLLINAESLLGADFRREFQGEPVGIIEAEGHASGERRLLMLAHFLQHLIQLLQALVQGFFKFFLLGRQLVQDACLVFLQFGIIRAVLGDDRGGQLAWKARWQVQRFGMANGAADQAPEDISLAQVAGRVALFIA